MKAGKWWSDSRRGRSLALAVWLLAGSLAPGAEFLGKSRPPQPVRRVVSLAPNLTEIVFALGAGELLAGVTRYDDWPPEVQALPRVGGFVDPSIEAILALKPDLVLCVPNPGGRQRLEVLDRMGVAVLVLPDYDLADLYRAIADLGAVLDRVDQAGTLTAGIRQGLARIAARAAADPSPPRALMVYGRQPLVVAGRGSFAHELLFLAGARNAAGDIDNRYPVLSLEQLLVLQPDIIIDASAGEGHGAGDQARDFWKRWPQLKAVRENRILVFDSSLWLRAGPRLVEGLEKLFVLLHPEPRR